MKTLYYRLIELIKAGKLKTLIIAIACLVFGIKWDFEGTINLGWSSIWKIPLGVILTFIGIGILLFGDTKSNISVEKPEANLDN